MNLLDDDILERSAVVANCRMNQERDLVGSNGYDKELGINPRDFLGERIVTGRHVAWLDLCCGSGRALIEAARIAQEEGLGSRISIVGVDLVGMFLTPEPGLACLRLVEASLRTWQPEGQFDLITYVHGLHYIGDKLGLISRDASWLVEDGLFVANLDVENLRSPSSRIPVESWWPSFDGPGWNMSAGNGWSSAGGRGYSTCHSDTSGPTTGPGRTTPGSPPRTPTTR
jgi:SAM-dependent methyltransferase